MSTQISVSNVGSKIGVAVVDVFNFKVEVVSNRIKKHTSHHVIRFGGDLIRRRCSG
ncbi:Uncharacterised protein [Vibrio cholerae]|nr:Uncharacterised protein [Vibrio cholerae]